MDKGRYPKVVRTWTVERMKTLPDPAARHKRVRSNRSGADLVPRV
jgi:hypothetical protein